MYIGLVMSKFLLPFALLVASTPLLAAACSGDSDDPAPEASPAAGTGGAGQGGTAGSGGAAAGSAGIAGAAGSGTGGSGTSGSSSTGAGGEAAGSGGAGGKALAVGNCPGAETATAPKQPGSCAGGFTKIEGDLGGTAVAAEYCGGDLLASKDFEQLYVNSPFTNGVDAILLKAKSKPANNVPFEGLLRLQSEPHSGAFPPRGEFLCVAQGELLGVTDSINFPGAQRVKQVDLKGISTLGTLEACDAGTPVEGEVIVDKLGQNSGWSVQSSAAPIPTGEAFGAVAGTCDFTVRLVSKETGASLFYLAGHADSEGGLSRAFVVVPENESFAVLCPGPGSIFRSTNSIELRNMKRLGACPGATATPGSLSIIYPFEQP